MIQYCPVTLKWQSVNIIYPASIQIKTWKRNCLFAETTTYLKHRSGGSDAPTYSIKTQLGKRGKNLRHQIASGERKDNVLDK